MNLSIHFSVIIPTHNRPEGLAKAIASVFSQTLLPGELIVVDDGSLPAVPQGLFASVPKGIKTTILRTETPQGAPHARNLGIETAKGEWIAFLDDDDIFLPSKLQTISDVLAKNPKVDLIYHQAEICLVKERVTYRSGVKDVKKIDGLYKRLLIKNLIGGTSMVVIRKDVLKEINGFDTSLPALQDWELWIRLARHNKSFLFIKDILVKYYHDNSTQSITKDHKKMLHAYDIIKEKYEEDYACLSQKQKKEYDINKLNNLILRDLLNNRTRSAFNRQLTKFLFAPGLKDLLLLLIIPFGSKWVYRFRSVL